MKKVLMLSLLLVLAISLTSCSFLAAFQDNQLEVDFVDWRLDEEVSLRLPGNSSGLIFYYNGFHLKEGELVLYIFDENKHIITDYVWQPGSNSKGNFTVPGLKKGKKYDLLLRGRNQAHKGALRITWDYLK